MQKIVVCITGASGSAYAKQILTSLTELRDQIETLSVVMTENAKLVWQTELNDHSYQDFEVQYYDQNDFMAPFASGSAQYDSMIIIPCSMGTLGRIASGISNDLISRAADVMLKERKKLILVPRETPYHLIHLQNMLKITEAGGIVCPASPSFYSKPETLNELVQTVTQRVIDLTGLKQKGFRWGTTPVQ